MTTPFEPIIPQSLDRLYSQRGHSPGVRVGDLLIVSGMLGRDASLNVVLGREAQLVQMFDNFALVLGAAGCGWRDVVELTAYFTDLRRDYALFGEVRRRYLAEPWPSITLIGVAALSQPDLICEMKGMAAIPRGGGAGP